MLNNSQHHLNIFFSYFDCLLFYFNSAAENSFQFQVTYHLFLAAWIFPLAHIKQKREAVCTCNRKINRK